MRDLKTTLLEFFLRAARTRIISRGAFEEMIFFNPVLLRLEVAVRRAQILLFADKDSEFIKSREIIEMVLQNSGEQF